jgi:hypothetical protein
MNFKTTGLLVALLLVVTAVWVFYPKSAQTETAVTPARPAQADTQPLLSPAAESKSIVRVAVERPDKPRLIFSRAPKADQPEQMENWKAEEPLAVPVQGYTVDGLVSTMTSLQSRQSFEPGEAGGVTEADAGLKPPRATVTLTDKNGKEYKFEVGQKAAMSTDTYVRLGGEKQIHIVSRDLESQVKRDFDEYRDKKLLTLTPSNAVRLAMQVAGKPYEFARGADGDWVVDAPIKAHAERDPVVELLRKLSALRAVEFLDGANTDLASYGLDRPYLVANITTETKKTVPQPPDESSSQPAAPKTETVTENLGLQIGGFADLKQENRYVKLAGQDWIATVAQKDVAPLVPDMAKLRDPRITRIRPNSATKLALSAEGLTVVLEKKAGKWQGQGELADLDPAAVNDLLQAFEDLRAIDYIDEPGEPSEYGLAEPRAVVSVTVTGSVEPVTLRIGNPTKSGRNAYVQRDGEPTVFVVSAPQAYRMVVPPLTLRSRNIFCADEKNIQRLLIEHGTTRYELAHEDGQWKPTQALNVPLEQAPVNAIANDLSHLRARKVVAHGNEAQYGLDQPALTIQFGAAEPAPPTTQPASQPESAAAAVATKEHTLRVAQRNKTAYACFDDDPYVYELDDTVYRVLTAELLERKLFPFAADDVVGVTVIQPSGTLEFAKQDEQWVFVPDPFVKIDQDKIKQLITALSGLQAESFVQYRGGDFQANGLFTAPLTVSLKLKSGDLANLKIEQKVGSDSPLAGWVEQKCVFRLAPGDYDSMVRPLDHYLQVENAKPEASKTGTGNAGPPRSRKAPPRPRHP